MPWVDRDGVGIYYEVHGDGPPLLLTHGYSSTSAMWHGQVDALATDHQLILWDMRGHGQSDYPDDPKAYSEAHTADDMAAVLDAVGAERAVIGGLSLGGYMSLAFYRGIRKRPRPADRRHRPRLQEGRRREAWNARALATADKVLSRRPRCAKAATRERATASHRDAKGFALAARGMLTQRNARVIELLPDIKVPTLIVVGADDAPFLAASDYMAAKIPRAQKIVIPAAGHAVNIDQPQAFVDAVVAFLKNLPG